MSEVLTDEGFWAVSAGGLDIWVQLVGEGESPVDVEPEVSLIVSGTLGSPTADSPVADDPRLLSGGHVVDVAFDAISTSP